MLGWTSGDSTKINGGFPIKKVKNSRKKQLVFIKVNICPWKKKRKFQQGAPYEKRLKNHDKSNLYKGGYKYIKGKKERRDF